MPAVGMLGLLLYALTAAPKARASVLSEDFAYTVGSGVQLQGLAGGSGWGANAWQSGSGSVYARSNSISYSSGGYAISQVPFGMTNAGSVCGQYTAYRGGTRTVGTPLTNVVWFSALVNLGTNGGQGYIGFNSSQSSAYNASTTYTVGISNGVAVVGYGGSTSGAGTWTEFTNIVSGLSVTTTHLILGRITFPTSSGNSKLEVWVDPANLSALSAAQFTQNTKNIGASLTNICVGGASITQNSTPYSTLTALRFSDGNGNSAQAFTEVTGAANSVPSPPVVVGAIRWDAAEDNSGSGSVGDGFQAVLSPNQWHYRLPFFAQVTGSNYAVIGSNYVQSTMDAEINYVANAGLNYWAFDLYPETNNTLTAGLSRGLHLYLSSQYKSRINFACLVGGNVITSLSGMGTWAQMKARLLSYFEDPSYQTVLGNRPLFFVLTPMPTNVVTTAGYITDLRSACTNAGLGNPYIVYQNSEQNATNGYNVIQTYGMDALGSYGDGAGYGGSTTGEAFNDLSVRAQNLWAAQAGTTAQVVPTVTSGWDNRPFIDTPETLYPSPSPYYYLPPAPEELGSELNAALNWTSSNTNGTTPANAALFYAWNEHAEGGWICPTLNTNDWITPDTSRLDAIAANLALFSFPNRVTNYSFELPVCPAVNWYPGALPSSFGWTNNLGSNVLCSAGLHFDAAADGFQSLTLSNGCFISRDTGPTVGDTSYKLGFNLLQGKDSPNTNASVQAQIFDGPNLLAVGTFFVPAVSNVWKQFTLSATSPHTPAGDLIIKFSGGTNGGAPWIDQVSLAEASLSTPPFINSQPQSQTNATAVPMAFSVSAIGGAAALTYHWQTLLSDGIFHNLTDGNAVSGSSSSTLWITNVSSTNLLSYRVVITNIYGSVTSSVATLLWYPIQTLSVTNASFELPVISPNGWYSGSSMPSSFGWSNNLTSFCLSTYGSQFNPAADGNQALWLANGKYVSQSTGPTTPDKLYSLKFSLLQSPYAPNTSASVSAEILDGPNLLATNKFVVPGTANVWQICTLNAVSPHSPAGNLIIRFTGGAVGEPFIDAVSLSKQAPPVAGLGMQQAAGGQLILNWGQGTLMEATNVVGPWTLNFNVPPYTITPTNGMKFYRILQ